MQHRLRVDKQIGPNYMSFIRSTFKIQCHGQVEGRKIEKASPSKKMLQKARELYSQQIKQLPNKELYWRQRQIFYNNK